MRFLADMGVDIRVVRWLRDGGHDAVHLRDEGLHRLPNGDIFGKAISEGRIILTFDLDFGEIAAASKERPAQVIVFRLRNTRAAHVINRLAAVLAESIAVLGRGVVISVEESRHRIRYLPIGSTNE
jgi:predicted nuclease of predicted toxin-antitoxin system